MSKQSEIGVLICPHIFERTKPVLLVAREYGDLMFLCGAEHSENEKFHVVGLNHLLDHDPTLREVSDIEEGYEAERQSVGDPWIRTPIETDQ